VNYEIFTKKLKSGDIIDYAVQYYRQNFKTFLIMTLFFHVPILMISSYLLDYTSFYSNLSLSVTNTSAQFSTGYIIAVYLGLIILSLYEATIFYVLVLGVMKKSYNEVVFNEILSPKQSIKHGFKTFGWVILFFIIASSVISFIYGVVVIFFAIGITVFNSFIQSVPLAIALIVLFLIIILFAFVYLITKLIFILPVISVEGKDCIKAIKPSFKVSKNNFWKVFLTIFFGYCFSVQLPNIIQSVSLLVPFDDILVFKIIRVLVSGITAVLTPLFYIIITFIYINHKVQNKNIDFEVKLRKLVSKESPTITFGRDVKEEISEDSI